MNKEIKYLKYFIVFFIIGLTILFGSSLFFDIQKEFQSVNEFAIVEGRASFNKDLLYRHWASMHGGVYVPITDITLPNPYLSHIPDRDITTEKGKKLTLINPAYMTRQAFTIGEKQYAIKGHLTSLNPIRKENKPDDWEMKALKVFEKGELEFSSIEKIEGIEYMRFMRPMKVEQSCLKCHSQQGYKVGDIRGGISVSVPMEKYNTISNSYIKKQIITYLLLYTTILIFVIFGYRRFLKEMIKQNLLQNKIIESEANLKIQNSEYAALNEEYKSQNEELHRAKQKSEKSEQNLQIKNNQYEAINEELRETNCELSKAKEKSEESDRLKTAFLQNMSHEIRTPLNAISGFTGMLNKPELSEEKRKSFVSIIQNSSKQLISIVTDILTISSLETKQEKANFDKVCINNIIVDLLAIFKQQAQNQNISLYAKQQLSDKQSETYTDKTKITQILTNLLTNALKFTHEGFIEFGYNLKDSELEFYVKDTGIGIKQEFHEKIFERFRQADKSINKLFGGTGLGLAISKAFAELLGGKIWVQSELEKGSTFYFTIPYKPINEIDKNTTPTIQNQNFRTILVAEDEEYNFLFIEELLIDMDLKLIHAKDGRETIEIFKSNPNIDLILMDIKMPIMTGHEASIIIKELNTNIPIIAQSAYALEHERAKYEGIFDDYLTKPINGEDLKQKVLKYIDIKKHL